MGMRKLMKEIALVSMKERKQRKQTRDTILAERNATVAKSSINFGDVLLLNECSIRPQIGPVLKVCVKSSS